MRRATPLLTPRLADRHLSAMAIVASINQINQINQINPSPTPAALRPR
jgi:hypothetical protein